MAYSIAASALLHVITCSLSSILVQSASFVMSPLKLTPHSFLEALEFIAGKVLFAGSE